jgi:hypothetical protein
MQSGHSDSNQTPFFGFFQFFSSEMTAREHKGLCFDKII